MTPIRDACIVIIIMSIFALAYVHNEKIDKLPKPSVDPVYTDIPMTVIKDGHCEIKRFYDQHRHHYYSVCDGKITGITDVK